MYTTLNSAFWHAHTLRREDSDQTATHGLGVVDISAGYSVVTVDTSTAPLLYNDVFSAAHEV
jgi:hypothetical protein